ncbi:YpiB family protein [Enterococcus cecorum]|uniref:YpiB family protein n=1 Tax=Enterococcus cecorum TaxID=44008 RepID=UPI0022D28DFC|nr:YpiB family protein [Enterococcus cecorum]
MAITLSQKKKFLSWFITSQTFNRREVSWLVNYLISHEAILNNVHIVEKAQDTPRGLVIQTMDFSDIPILLFKDQVEFVDVDQIFHEIRFHWQDDLYLECRFKDAWQESIYLGVLEDNPYASWNDNLDSQFVSQVDNYFNDLARENQKRDLMTKINQALEANDEATFAQLSSELKALS